MGTSGTLTSGGAGGAGEFRADGFSADGNIPVYGAQGYAGGGLGQAGGGSLGGAAGYSLVSTDPNMLVDVIGPPLIGAYLNVSPIDADVVLWRDAC
jgi:hypothetical protein